MTTIAPAPSSDDLLAWADRLLGSRGGVPAGCRARAVAVLTRQALEAAIAEVWTARRLPLDACSIRSQLLCLRVYLDDDRLAAQVDQTWGALSSACHHHHPYELAPTAAELHAWLETVAGINHQLAQVSSGCRA